MSKKKHYFDLSPIKKSHSNAFLGGRPAEPSETYIVDGEVKGMPITRIANCCFSIWRCSSIWWRIVFLFKGELALNVIGNQHPAVSICINDPFELVGQEQ